MPTFHYQARNAEQQPVTGELQAESVQDAIAELEARGLTLQSIAYAPVETVPPTVHRITVDANAARDVIEQTILRPHLAKVLEQGQAIVPALRAFSEELPAGRRRNELQQLIRILERGDAADAEQAFAELPDYWIPLLSAAVSSSDPGRILQQFIKESQRADELRRQWWLMLAYPLFIVGMAGAVFVALSILVIPIFRDIFRGFGLKLPPLTLLNLHLAGWIEHTWPFILIAFGLLFGGLILYWFLGPMRRFKSSQPLSAFLGRTSAIARLSQFMADLLEAGLSTADTLKVAGFLTNRTRLRKSVWRLADHLATNPAAAKHLAAPSRMATVYHALRSDIPNQSRIRLLREIAQVNSERIRLRLSWTRGMIEPAAIIVIGFVVAIVVISLFLPLVKLIEGLSK